MRPEHQLFLLALGVCLLGSTCNHQASATSVKQESGKEIEKLVESDNNWMQQLQMIVQNIKTQWDQLQGSSQKTHTGDDETNLLEFLISAVHEQRRLLTKNKYSETEIPLSGSANRHRQVAPRADCNDDVQSSCASNNTDQDEEDEEVEIGEGDGDSRLTGRSGLNSGSNFHSKYTVRKPQPLDHRGSAQATETDPLRFRKEQLESAIKRSNSFLKDILDNELQVLAFNLISNKLTGEESSPLRPIQQGGDIGFKLAQYLVGLLVDILSAVFGRKLDVGHSGAAMREHKLNGIEHVLTRFFESINVIRPKAWLDERKITRPVVSKTKHHGWGRQQSP